MIKGLYETHLYVGDLGRSMVFSWIPAISIYFDDPDGHSLEFIGLLKGKPQPELGVISYEAWLKTVEKENGI